MFTIPEDGVVETMDSQIVFNTKHTNCVFFVCATYSVLTAHENCFCKALKSIPNQNKSDHGSFWKLRPFGIVTLTLRHSNAHVRSPSIIRESRFCPTMIPISHEYFNFISLFNPIQSPVFFHIPSGKKKHIDPENHTNSWNSNLSAPICQAYVNLLEGTFRFFSPFLLCPIAPGGTRSSDMSQLVPKVPRAPSAASALRRSPSNV